MYLEADQVALLTSLIKTFVSLPYSTNLDGKDVETLLRIVKGAEGPLSKRKELFDIVDGDVGYSIKTLDKSPTSSRVDLQEQRFCEVEEIRRIMSGEDARSEESKVKQGHLLLSYMKNRLEEQMAARNITVAKSLILLKNWDKAKSQFFVRYWEEDFKAYIDNLLVKNDRKEIEWVLQPAGLHGRDKLRQDKRHGGNVRLLRMHYKHNQIFTDHDIPADAIQISVQVKRLSWQQLAQILDRE